MPKSHSEDFFPEMSNLKDEQLHILRGHLLIEKKLRELIDLKVERPDALSEAKLSFHQILCITEALYWENDSDRL